MVVREVVGVVQIVGVVIGEAVVAASTNTLVQISVGVVGEVGEVAAVV